MGEHEVQVDVDLSLDVLCDVPSGCKQKAVARLVTGHEVGAWCETWALCRKHAASVKRDLQEALSEKSGMACYQHGRAAVWWWRPL